MQSTKSVKKVGGLNPFYANTKYEVYQKVGGLNPFYANKKYEFCKKNGGLNPFYAKKYGFCKKKWGQPILCNKKNTNSVKERGV